MKLEEVLAALSLIFGVVAVLSLVPILSVVALPFVLLGRFGMLIPAALAIVLGAWGTAVAKEEKNKKFCKIGLALGVVFAIIILVLLTILQSF